MVSHLVSNFIYIAIAAIVRKINKSNKTPEMSNAECLVLWVTKLARGNMLITLTLRKLISMLV